MPKSQTAVQKRLAFLAMTPEQRAEDRLAHEEAKRQFALEAQASRRNRECQCPFKGMSLDEIEERFCKRHEAAPLTQKVTAQ